MPPQNQNDENPAVSPDGKTLLFTRTRNPDAGDLYIVPITGGEPRQVRFDQETSVSYPIWLPDSSRVTWRENRGGGGDEMTWGRTRTCPA